MEWLNILVVEDETPLAEDACGIYQTKQLLP